MIWIGVRALVLGGLASCVAIGGLSGQTPRALHLPAQFVQHSHELNGRIGFLVELGGGRCLISDEKTAVLQLVDWKNDIARPVGRKGRGPGEYQTIERMFGLGGDSTLVHDRSLQKLLVATSAGLHDAGTVKPAVSNRSYLRGADQGGRFLQVAGFRFRWPAKALAKDGPLSAAESMYVLVSRGIDGAPDTIAHVRGPTQRLVRTTMIPVEGRGAVPAIIANPLAGGDAVAMYPDGWIAIAYREPYRVDWFPPGGAPVRGPRLEARPAPVDSRVKEAIIADLRKDTPGATVGMFDDWPALLPAFVGDALVQSFDGRLLVARTVLPNSRTRVYDMIDRRGERQAAIELPSNATLLYAGRFGLYVLVMDEDDVGHLRRYPNMPSR